jgi:hypothetical protein
MSLKKSILIIILLMHCFFFFSCKQSGRSATDQKYKLVLHILPGSRYYYTIHNETEIKLEVTGKKVESSNKSTVGLIYEIVKDTASGFVLKITYDSFHIVSKNGDAVTEMDAANATNSIDPAEKMLGSLKGNSLLITITTKGEIISVSGYKEITDKLMSFIDINNESDKNKVQAQISEMLGENFIKNNLEQSLKIFPDSALYIGNSWTKNETQPSDLKLNLSTTYTLESVEDSIAEIKSVSEINNANTNANVMGYDATVNFSGNEKGVSKADLKTGFLLNQKSTINVEGTVELNATKVPVNIKMTRELTARKL